jgi:hypothetical protein
MKIIGLIVVSLTLSSLAFAQQGAAVGKVETKSDGKANFAAFHTYSWTPGLHADNPAVHKMIVAACEAEMTKLGFKSVATGADTTLAYYTVRSTEVDLKALDKLEKQGLSGDAATKTLGRLVVVMRTGSTSPQQVWSASTREFVDQDPAKMNDIVRSVAARLFETYPGRKAAR